MKRIIAYLLAMLGVGAWASAASSALPSPQAVASKWSTRTQAAAQDYADGVANTDKDPTQLAIAAGQRYLANVVSAFNTGKWANGLRRAGKAGWQQGVKDKGQTNFSTGVAAAEGKVAEAFTPLLAYEANLQNQVKSMPNTTDADRETRMLTWTRGMRKYSKS